MATLIDLKAYGKFDADGFLLDTQKWDPELANDIAEKDGLEYLTQAHWNIIYYLREHYYKYHNLPVMRHVCRLYGMPSHCVDELFHGCKEAWRISGLPNPGEEAKTYM